VPGALELTATTMSSLIFSSPEDVETTFYKAIEKRSLIALMSVWSEDEEIICIHPTGVRLVGFSAIQASWRGILGGPGAEIRCQVISQWQGMMVAVRHMIEYLYAGKEVSGPIQSTHVYLRGSHGWRLVCRHASPAAGPLPEAKNERRVLH
jgi:ketosteroid isomerase-like protein